MDRNKRVFIVKNNSFQSEIYKNAEKSVYLCNLPNTRFNKKGKPF